LFPTVELKEVEMGEYLLLEWLQILGWRLPTLRPFAQENTLELPQQRNH
jgi:hypothetical protein